MQITSYRFGADPLGEFNRGGLLYGFDPEEATPEDMAAAEATGIPLSDEESVGILADGRLAIVGPTVEGHPFWIEIRGMPLAMNRIIWGRRQFAHCLSNACAWHATREADDMRPFPIRCPSCGSMLDVSREGDSVIDRG